MDDKTVRRVFEELLHTADTLADLERALYIEALRHADGNQQHAAQSLGVTRYTLRYAMQKYDLKDLFPATAKGGRKKRSPEISAS